MHIAILGGSFDPPHLGHLLVASQIRKHFPIDQVWLVPCNKHPFGKKLSSAKHRLAMTRLVKNNLVRISDIEIKKHATSYSVETLQQLQTEYPEHSFFWVIGSDQVRDFPKWKNWQTIIEKFGIIVYPRNHTVQTTQTLIKETFQFQTIPPTFLYPKNPIQTSPISSTEIRERIKTNQSITHLVTPAVAAYIMEQKLYE